MIASRVEIASEHLELLQRLENVSHREVFRKTRVEIVLDRLHETNDEVSKHSQS